MKRTLLVAAIALLLTLVALGGWGWLAWQRLHEPFGRAGETVTLSVPSGETAAQILERLAAAGVIADAETARLYLIHVLDDPPLQAGDYRFELPTTVPGVLAKLIEGAVVLQPVTVVEGLTVEETARSLADQGFGSYERYLPLVRSPELIADLDPVATDLEGYLFPDTYHFPRTATEDEVVRTMVATFRRRMAESFPDLALGVREWVTLASIVEKEAGLDAERPVIAGVYRNRLDRGIGLYADPTIIYALKKLGRWDGDIRRKDLSLDSPYNTYRNVGLPPGPICSPGLASLEAAAAPADVPYLYFVSRNDGSHVFAETLREHNRNVDEWQRRYWRERRSGSGKSP